MQYNHEFKKIFKLVKNVGQEEEKCVHLSIVFYVQTGRTYVGVAVYCLHKLAFGVQLLFFFLFVNVVLSLLG